ncbi:glycosyltransferase [Candidatus Saccharibacteria bacterium]|nr:glycosyltransferase [Candidatus Saccharibacteria bacterium]
MRIVIATAVYYPMINGVAMFSYNLALGLARRGYEVMVLTPSQNKKYHVEVLDGVEVVYLKSKDIKIYPDQIHEVPEKKKFFYKNGLKASIFPSGQIRRVLDKFKPDVVYVQGSDPIGVAVVGYAKKHHIPVVTTEHNQPEVLTEPLHLPGVVRKPINNILSAYFRKRQKKSDYVTMPTQLSIDHLFKGKDLDVPVEAVSNGVDLSAFRPGKAKEFVYDKYDIPKDVPILLYVGRVDPEKKIGAVLTAFSDFLSEHKLDKLSKTFLLVVGDGVDKNRLETLAVKLGISGSVKFLGRVMPPDLYEIYKVGDAFVTASEIETQGIVLIEAAASGLPLLAVNAGAVAEVCKNNYNGYLLNPGDEKAMTKAMTDILLDDKKRALMSEKSVEIAMKHDFSHTLDKFLEIYQKLISKKR